MITRLGRAVHRSLASIYSSKFNHPQLNRFSHLNFNPRFSFSRNSSLPPFMQKVVGGFSSMNSNSDKPKVQNPTFSKVLYENPYIVQDNQRQIIEQGFLAFYTSHVIRSIDYKKYYLGLPHKSIGQFILELIGKIKKEQGQQQGFLPKNIEQFCNAFKIDNGIKLPFDIFGQYRIINVQSQNSLQVFNVTSLTCHVIKFANSGLNIYQDEFGFGKSFAFALNSYLTFLISKMLMLLKEKPQEKIKEMIIKHYKLFEQFHGPNDIKAFTVDKLVLELNSLNFQFYYELSEEDTWEKIIGKFLIQCPELKLNPKISKIIQTKQQRSLSVTQVKSFFQNLQTHFSSKNRHFKLIIDQGNIYYRRLNKINNYVKQIQTNNNIQNLQTALEFFKNDEKTPKDYLKMYNQLQHLSNILEVFCKSLIQGSVKICCSERAQVKIYKGEQFPVGFGYNPFSHGRVKLTRLLSQKDQFVFDWKQTELWYTFWFQLEILFFRTNPIYFNNLQKAINNIKLKNTFYTSFIEKGKNQRSFEWGSKMKQLIIRDVFQRQDIEYQIEMLKNLILPYSQQPEKQHQSVDQLFKNLVETLYFEMNYENIASNQAKYNYIRKDIQDTLKVPFQEKEGFFLNYLQQLRRQRKDKQNEEMIVTFDQIRYFLAGLKIGMSEQAEETQSFKKKQIALLYQFLREIANITQLQFRIEKQNRLVIKNPQKLLDYKPKKLFSQQLINAFKEGWRQNNTQFGIVFDGTFTRFISSISQKIQMNQVTFNIINDQIYYCGSLPNKLKKVPITDEKGYIIKENIEKRKENYQFVMKKMLQQFSKVKGRMKVGDSYALRPMKTNIKKYNQYNPGNPCFDLMIVTRISEKKWRVITLDLTVSEDNTVVKDKTKSVDEFIQNYLVDNEQFDMEYEYQHWVVCPKDYANSLDRTYQTKQQKVENKKSYPIKVVSLKTISFKKPKAAYHYIMGTYHKLFEIFKFMEQQSII